MDLKSAIVYAIDMRRLTHTHDNFLIVILKLKTIHGGES